MNWDDAKSHRLYDLFMNKSQNSWDRFKAKRKWLLFLDSIGVTSFISPHDDPWMTGRGYESPAKEDGEYILLLNPADPTKYGGLRMSKDFAEKFLVLGIVP